ncbi:hypothetical protein, partial [Dialister invisus]
ILKILLKQMRITTLIVNINIRMYHFNEIICTATLSFAYDNVNNRNLVSLSLEVVAGIPFLF